MLKENLESKNDPNVYNIAEMGIGLNPKCSFMGIMLEDEGVEGSVHIGIGTSITLGGKIKAASHYDLIMKNGTIDVDGKTILQDGKILI
jgi:leucyl aminopeptidase (aminopeptidase T)